MSSSKSKYAYIMLLMGNSPYFLGALITGYSLKQVKTKYDIVLMVTPEVPLKQKEILSSIFDRVVEIEHVKINPKIIKNYEITRFQDVFTKLQCLLFVEYEKIIMMDIDMLVVKNMDALFDLNPPSACSTSKHIAHGEPLTGRINAGVMLLSPNKHEYDEIIKDINRSNQNKQYKNPEQDYLSERYAGRWTSISFLYNFQFGKSWMTDKYNYNDAYNIHYSHHIKPWHLLENYEGTIAKLKAINTIIHLYTQWLDVYNGVCQSFKKNNIDLSKYYVHNPKTKLLQYSGELEKRVVALLPIITIINNYRIIGSFARKSLYVTDIDVNNNVTTGDINNIDKKLLKIINNLPIDTKFLYLTSGTNYKIPWNIVNEKTIHEYDYDIAKKFIEQIHEDGIIYDKDINTIYSYINKNADINKLLLVEDYLYSKIKKRWTKDDIISNGNAFNMSISENTDNVGHYILLYDNYHIIIDLGLNKNITKERNEFSKMTYLSYLKREYYWILSSIKYYFRKDKQRYEQIQYILNDSYGPHKQMTVNLFYVKQYLEYNMFESNDNQKYIATVLRNINDYTEYDNTKITTSIWQILNEYEKNKEQELIILLDSLYTDFTKYFHESVKGYAYYYLEMMKDKPKYYYLIEEIK